MRAQSGAQGRGRAQRVGTNIPFCPFADVDAIVDDNWELAVAMQQAL